MKKRKKKIWNSYRHFFEKVMLWANRTHLTLTKKAAFYFSNRQKKNKLNVLQYVNVLD